MSKISVRIYNDAPSCRGTTLGGDVEYSDINPSIMEMLYEIHRCDKSGDCIPRVEIVVTSTVPIFGRTQIIWEKELWDDALDHDILWQFIKFQERYAHEDEDAVEGIAELLKLLYKHTCKCEDDKEHLDAICMQFWINPDNIRNSDDR